MAGFDERFGIDQEAFPEDPNERRRLIDAYRSKYLLEGSRDRANRRAIEMGHKFRVPAAADWSVEPDSWAAADRSPSNVVIEGMDDPEVAGARNQVANVAAKGSMRPSWMPPPDVPGQTTSDQGTLPPEPDWLIAGRRREEIERAKADPVGPKRPEISTPEAIGTGLVSGASLGFGDEIKGAQKASGLPSSPLEGLLPGPLAAAPGVVRTAVGAVRRLVDPKAAETYDRSVDADRFRADTARQQHPVATTGAELAGGLLVPMPGGAGVSLGRQVLRQGGAGALTGGISALGEATDKTDTGGVGIGATLGGVVGGAFPVAGRLLSLVAGRPINTLRNWWNPQGGAERAVGAAAQESDRIAANEVREAARRNLPPPEDHRLTRQQMQAEPEGMVLDTLGQPGRDLARAATNTSGEAHGLLEQPLVQRAGGRERRNVGFLNDQSQYADPRATREAIARAAEQTNTPNYRDAFARGDFDLTAGNTGAQGLNRLVERSPAIQRAAREAGDALRDEYAGHGEVWHGVRNLEYWNAVKIQLDQQIGHAESRGLNADARRLTRIKDAMVERLDMQVPEYRNTRDVASTHFGQRDASLAGEAFFNRNRLPDDVAAFRQMNSTEQALFRDGLLAKTRDMASRTPNFWASVERNAGGIRDKLTAVLEPQQMRQLEARSLIERVMQSSRESMGNSSTARQLALRGLATAGGAGLAYGGGEDYGSYGSLLTAGGLAQLARKGGDIRVANRIAQVLRSNDPAVLERAATAFANNERVMNTLRLLSSQGRASATSAGARSIERGREGQR